jgi:hypothetical protein
MDVQIVRYLEAANITRKGFQSWMEDMYLNLSISPSMSNATLRGTCAFELEAWEDESDNVWSGGWSLEPSHIDYVGNTVGHTSYTSPFNAYDPDQTTWAVMEYVPGTTRYADNCSYCWTPMNHSLVQYESMIIKAPLGDVLGLDPDPALGSSDTLDAAKQDELISRLYWGRMVLADDVYPRDIVRNSYNSTTKTLTLTGPLSFPVGEQPYSGGEGVLLHSSPSFMFDVAKVTSYQVAVTGAHMVTMADTITVTALNGTGATVVDWNGTVLLPCDDALATLGSSTHTFDPLTDMGVWSTTVTWGTEGTWYVNATDQWFSPTNVVGAVIGSSGPITIAIIPEFGALLLPVIGAIATFVMISGRRRKTAS